MSYKTLRYEVSEKGVATIALDQPGTRNALSDELLRELFDALTNARDDGDVRCVVLTSTHEKVFSSGANLAGFAADVPLVRSAGSYSGRPARRVPLGPQSGRHTPRRV